MKLCLRVLVILLICDLRKLSAANDTESLGTQHLENSQCNKLDSSCSSTKLVVKGFHIKISDVLQISCYNNVKFIEVFALDKVTIDADIYKTGLKVHLSIIAPMWEVVGERNIYLNGSDGKPHSSDKALESVGDGRAGKPGKPGGASGCFFGIGELFIAHFNLNIFTNGGDGGPGQRGGKGTDGMKGRDPPLAHNSAETLQLWKEQNFQFYMVRNKSVFVEETNFTRHIHTYVILGKGSFLPGKGGNGGIGGIGGSTGEVLVLGLREAPKFKYFNNTGKNGAVGVGGAGGNKISNGKEFMVEFTDLYRLDNTIEKSFVNDFLPTVLNFTAGKDGIDGNNSYGVKYPEKETFLRPSHIINSYKYFARDCLAEMTSESKLKRFLQQLDGNQNVNSLYDTLALVDELDGLERQYFHESNKHSLVPFFQSLLNRISEYAKKTTEPIDHRKVLKFLYIATLNKLVSLRTKHNYVPIINWIEYMENLQEQVEQLREAKRNVIIAEFQDEYQNSLTHQINAANRFIANEIVPEIESLFNQTDYKIHESLNETFGLSVNATFDICEWLPDMPDLPPGDGDDENPCKPVTTVRNEYKASLQNSLILRQMLLGLKILPVILKSIGSVGVGAGRIIESKTINGNWLEKNETRHQNREEYLDLSTTLNTTLYHTGEQLKENHELFLEELNDIEYNLKETNPHNVNEILQKVNKIKETVIFQLKNNVIVDPSEINRLRKELNMFLKNRNVDVQPVTDQTSEEEYISKLQKEVLDDASSDESLEKYLKDLERYFYAAIVYQLRQFEKTFNEITQNMANKSHIELDISKWRIQSTLRDLKVYFRQFNKHIPRQDYIERIFEKLDEAINILLNMYDRIESYAEKAIFSAYIASIVTGHSKDTDNIELNKAVQKLRQSIQINFISEKYEKLKNAFKQYTFPLAPIHMATFDLPKDLQFTDTDSLIEEVIDKIDFLKKKIALLDVSEFDNEIFSDIDFSESIITSSFYRWGYEKHQAKINELLAGREIQLFANVSYGEQNAIKYNRIGIKLVAEEKDIQIQLDAVLENFAVTMTMVGNNYYRCRGKTYCIPVDRIVIDYSFKKGSNGQPAVSNELYKKIQKNGYVLSPYGLWSIKLKNISPSNSGDFSKLAEFLDVAVDVHLTGRGQYLSNESLTSNICTDDLDKFYDLCNNATDIF